MIDICICTHGPDPSTLERVIKAICAQTLPRNRFQVLIIDNASKPALRLTGHPLRLLSAGKINARLVRESKLGVAHARVRALKESKAKAVVFVDDDNILAKDFLKNAQRILNARPNVGCFSGKIEIPADLVVPEWVEPLLRNFAIRDAGDRPILGWFRGIWQPWIPAATASMVLRREVADVFLKTHARRAEFGKFGRKGHRNLMSGEDFLIALSAADAGFMCGYFPELTMYHFVHPSRFNVRYVAKLMGSMAITGLKHEKYLGLKPKPFHVAEMRSRLLLWDFKGKPLKSKFCYWVYQAIVVAGKTYNLVSEGLPLFETPEDAAQRNLKKEYS